MRSRLSSPKDFWAGVLYLAIGAGAMWIAKDYRIGTAGRMGPGYFPLVLSALLMGVGLLSLARSLMAPGDAITPVAWKPMALVLAAPASFAFLLPRTGVVLALPVLALVAAAASRQFRLDWKATAGLAALVAFSVLVFVKALGVPMPILGTWLAPFVSNPRLL